MKNTEQAGGTRYSDGKAGGWWYGPILGMLEVQRVAQYGAEKYAPLDWREGQSFSTLLDCATRHLIKALHYGPTHRDEESGCLSVAHAAWNLLAILTATETGEHLLLDDTERWRGVTAGTKHLMEENDVEADEEDPAADCGAYDGALGFGRVLATYDGVIRDPDPVGFDCHLRGDSIGEE